MDDLKTEREQLDALRDWFNRNGSFLVTGVSIGLIVLFGYRYWEESTRASAEAASVTFNRMSNAFESKDQASARSAALELLGQTPNTLYGGFAALMLARLAVDEGKFEEARDHLKWIVDERADDALTGIAKLRLAQVYLQLREPKLALAVAGPEVNLPNTAEVQELRGDIYRALKNDAEARKFYTIAAGLDPEALSDSERSLGLKLDALGGPLQAEDDSNVEATAAAADALSDQLSKVIEEQATSAPEAPDSESMATEAVSPEPVGTEPASTDEPATSEPARTESGAIEPASTEPNLPEVPKPELPAP